MARNAENDAVPPPMSKYGIELGMSEDDAGSLIICLFSARTLYKVSSVGVCKRLTFIFFLLFYWFWFIFPFSAQIIHLERNDAVAQPVKKSRM